MRLDPGECCKLGMEKRAKSKKEKEMGLSDGRAVTIRQRDPREFQTQFDLPPRIKLPRQLLPPRDLPPHRPRPAHVLPADPTKLPVHHPNAPHRAPPRGEAPEMLGQLLAPVALRPVVLVRGPEVGQAALEPDGLEARERDLGREDGHRGGVEDERGEVRAAGEDLDPVHGEHRRVLEDFEVEGREAEPDRVEEEEEVGLPGRRVDEDLEVGERGEDPPPCVADEGPVDAGEVDVEGSEVDERDHRVGEGVG